MTRYTDTACHQSHWTRNADSSRTRSPVLRSTKRRRQTGSDTSSSANFRHDQVDAAALDLELFDATWMEAFDEMPAAVQKSVTEDPPARQIQLCAVPGLIDPDSMSDGVTDLLGDPPIKETAVSKPRMRTGCISCLMQGKACDPRDPQCKRTMSDDWSIKRSMTSSDEDSKDRDTVEAMTLHSYRPDLRWRRNWRERQSLNFFVNFSAPQMAGFFDSAFWQRVVIQTSYHEPAILHAITAIGALHEAMLQRGFTDERRKAQTINFALSQCNRAISCLTDSGRGGRRMSNSRLALTTCVLSTCFEAMQGHCDSAVNHALQGLQLLQACDNTITASTVDELEDMRPLVERLEVQATALLDKGKRHETSSGNRTTPLPDIEYIFSLNHAHNALHTAMNSVMRCMQGYNPTVSRDQIALQMTDKSLRYAPWFRRWEGAFTTYLAFHRDTMSSVDIKRAMVLKTNHLVGTMLASVDQSGGPAAYDAYEAEFKAIIDLSREVLTAFPCPPLPTLTSSNLSAGAPYLSFSLWVTDPLWMAISRCRNPSLRQAAFGLLSQNPRQEGIWHARPGSQGTAQNMKRVAALSGRPK